MLDNYVGGGSALLARTSIVRAAGGWDERISCCDWDLWRRLSFDHEIHFVDQVLVRYRRHASNRGDDVAFMLPGMVVHFGKILQDTPPRLRHMLPAAKRQFFDYLTNSSLAEGLQLDLVDALQAKCRRLEQERDAVLSSRSWRVTAPLRRLSRGLQRLIGSRQQSRSEAESIPLNVQAGPALPAARSSKRVRDQRGIDRQAIFVGIGVIVGLGRHVDDHHVRASDVMLRVPHESRNIDHPAIQFRHRNSAYLATGRRLRPRIIEHEVHVSLQYEVSVLMGLVEPPAFDESRPNREAMGGHQRGLMPLPAEVVDLDHASALVGVRRCLTNAHALDQRADHLALRRDRLLVAGCGGQSLIQKRRCTIRRVH